MSETITESELSFLTVLAQLTGGGNSLISKMPTVSGTTLTYIFSLGPFIGTNSENYTCTATISGPDSVYLTAAETGELSDTITITTGNSTSLK